MDRGRDSDPEQTMTGELAREIAEALALTLPGPTVTRATFRGAQLELVRGLLIDRSSGVELARLAPRLRLCDVEHVVITSPAIVVKRSQLTTRCTGPCGCQRPLLVMGFRVMGDGTLRNQPQCPACRARYPRRG